MTSNRPYTDTDLRAEAARQHATLSEDPDFMGVGEQMEDAPVESTDDGDTSLTWTDLLVPEGAGASYEAFGDAQRKIHDLIQGAADVSEWAVDLGADGLVPDDESVDIANGDVIGVRIHFAFHPDMPEEMRASVIAAVHSETAASAAEEQPAVEESEACGKCKQPFDPADTRFDGQARYRLTPYCRGCVDRCHDTEIADHRCVICA